MDIVLKSLVSAIVTAVILLIAKYSGPKMAGAIGGVPIVFAVSHILLTMGDRAVAHDLLVGGIYGAIAGVIFCLVLLWLNAQFVKTHWLNFVAAYVVCFLFALLLVHFTSKT